MFCKTRSLHSSWKENRCRCGPNWPKIQDPGGADIPHGACLILKTPKKLAMERLLIHSHVMKVRTAVTISARKDEKSTVDSTWRCNMLACNTKKNRRSQSCLWLQAGALERIMWGTGTYIWFKSFSNLEINCSSYLWLPSKTKQTEIPWNM